MIIGVPAHDGFSGKAVNHVLDMPPHHMTHWSSESLAYVAKAYGVELQKLAYEPIAKYHIHWAKSILIAQKIRKILGMPPSLLDVSTQSAFVAKLSMLIAKFLPMSMRDQLGHTMVAVYEKRA